MDLLGSEVLSAYDLVLTCRQDGLVRMDDASVRTARPRSQAP